MAELLYAAEAHAALRANLSPRYRRLDRLERYVAGTQYDGRPSFWDQDTPMHDRAPCVVYPIVQSAIRSNVDLCLGEGRWPTITSFVDEDDSSFDESLGLSEDDSETLDRATRMLEEHSRLRAVARELLASAQGCGTAVAICGVRNGKLCVDTTRAKWCKPTFLPSEPDTVETLEIQYPYLEEYFDDAQGKHALRCMLYRRVIDAARDVTFKPLRADVNGALPRPGDWAEDKTKTRVHGLGFCPVIWYRFLRECSTVDELDGEAIHKNLLDELDAMNFALSQWHVAALVASSPPTIEIGVDDDVQPADVGRTAATTAWHPPYTDANGVLHEDDPANKQWRRSSGPVPARKRSPGGIWRYPSATTTVSQLVMPGDALDPVEKNCRDLRAKIAEALSVVFTDPENMRTAGDISGRALRERHRPQIERCDTIREDFGAGCLLKLVDMLMRICTRVDASRLRVPGLKSLLPIVSRFEETVALDDGTTSVEWCPPSIHLVWGEYYTPTEADQKQIVDGTISAMNGGLITRRTAIERMKSIGYNIGNVDEYLDSLEEHDESDAAKAVERQVAAVEQFGAVANPEDEHGQPTAVESQ